MYKLKGEIKLINDMISFCTRLRSPPTTRKFSTGNTTNAPATGNLQANLSPSARNRSRSRSPSQRKTLIEPIQVSSRFDRILKMRK